MDKKLKRLIGFNIKKARKDKNLSVKDLADKLKVSMNYVYQIESGRGGFTLETLSKFSEALEIDLKSLLEDQTISGEPTLDREEKIKSTDVTVLERLIEQLMKVLKESGVELPPRVSNKTNEEFMLELIKLLPPDMKRQITLELVKETFKNQD